MRVIQQKKMRRVLVPSILMMGQAWNVIWLGFAVVVALIAFLSISGIVDLETFDNTNLSIAAGTLVLAILTKSLSGTQNEAVVRATRPYLVCDTQDNQISREELHRGLIRIRNVGPGPGIMTDVQLTGKESLYGESKSAAVVGNGESILANIEMSSIPDNQLLKLTLFYHDMYDSFYLTTCTMKSSGADEYTITDMNFESPTSYQIERAFQ